MITENGDGLQGQGKVIRRSIVAVLLRVKIDGLAEAMGNIEGLDL